MKLERSKLRQSWGGGGKTEFRCIVSYGRLRLGQGSHVVAIGTKAAFCIRERKLGTISSL